MYTWMGCWEGEGRESLAGGGATGLVGLLSGSVTLQCLLELEYPSVTKKKTKTEIKLCMDTKCLGSNNLLWVVWGAGEYPKSGTCWRLLLWLALCCGGESSSAVKLGGWRSLDWLNLTHSSTVSFHFLQREKWIRIQKSVRGEEGFRVWWW